MSVKIFFTNLNKLRQNVNQWLCIALISLMTFWTVLYYATHKADAVADEISSATIELIN